MAVGNNSKDVVDGQAAGQLLLNQSIVMQKNMFKPMLLALLVLSLSTNVSAQPDPGPPPVGGGGGLPSDPDAEVPFDGGLSILLAAGAGYGAKKAIERRKALKAAVQYK